GRASFVLPTFEAPIHFFPRRGEREDAALTLDTLIIEPDLQRFTLTWRATRPIKKNIFEVAQPMVGKRSKDWWVERERPGFRMYLSLIAMRTVEQGQQTSE